MDAKVNAAGGPTKPTAPEGRRRSICLFSLSSIPDDPRVHRQGDLFHEAGWEVHAFGASGARCSLPAWKTYPDNWTPPVSSPVGIARANSPAESERKGGSLLALVHNKLPRLLAVLNPLMKRWLTPVQNWRWVLFQLELPKAWAARKSARQAIEDYLGNGSVMELYKAAQSVKADIYLANDWHMLPIAVLLAEEHGGYVCYDTHEYAIEEYRQYLDWRLTRIPIAKAIEGEGLRRALVTSTVSQGIADDMTRVYGLKRPILEIRNVPNRSAVEPRPCGPGDIGVLYHGLIVKDRGLEHCIRSIRFWRNEFHFILRGPVSPEFKQELMRIACESGVENRITFLPSVPMTDLVRCAREDGDIGLFAPLTLSRHYKYVLPNKLFEYIHAGLAICVADLPDMARVVRRYDLGHLISEVEPRMIATAINRFTRADIDRFKRHSAAASEELCWELESQKMLGAYEAALAAHGR